MQQDDFPEYRPPARGRLTVVIIGIALVHLLLFIALTQRVSTSGMGEKGPVYPEQYVPACEETDILGPVGIVNPAGVQQPQRMLRQGELLLPPVIAAQKISGEAILGLSIDKTGKVTRSCIAKSSGDIRFDTALWANAATWRFSPGQANGAAASWRLNLPVRATPLPGTARATE